MLDQVFQERPLLGAREPVEALGVHRQGGDAVTDGDAGSLAVQGTQLAPQVEDEVAVKGALPQQAHHGVFQGVGRHGG